MMPSLPVFCDSKITSMRSECLQEFSVDMIPTVNSTSNEIEELIVPAPIVTPEQQTRTGDNSELTMPAVVVSPEQQADTSDKPKRTTRATVTTSEQQVASSGKPKRTTRATVTTSEQQVASSGKPKRTTRATVTTSEQQVASSDKPKRTTRATVTTSEQQVASSGKPKRTTRATVTTHEQAVGDDALLTTPVAIATPEQQEMTGKQMGGGEGKRYAQNGKDLEYSALRELELGNGKFTGFSELSFPYGLPLTKLEKDIIRAVREHPLRSPDWQVLSEKLGVPTEYLLERVQLLRHFFVEEF
ncbi:MAG: hypothetical protein QXS54_00740 [Candidatus Methanomethylicaceae archaeon]